MFMVSAMILLNFNFIFVYFTQFFVIYLTKVYRAFRIDGSCFFSFFLLVISL